MIFGICRTVTVIVNGKFGKAIFIIVIIIVIIIVVVIVVVVEVFAFATGGCRWGQ